MAEIRNEKFSRELQKNLFPDNDFYKNSKVDGAPAPDVTTVSIPQAATPIASTFGAIQDGQANLATANSLAPKVRLNNVLTYNVEVFGTEATALQLIDLRTITYDKRASLLEEQAKVVNTQIANFSAIQFAQETANPTFITKTTGTDTRSNLVVGGSSSVANVKRITKEDVVNVKRLFQKMNLGNLGSGDLFSLITPDQWEDLILIDELVNFEKTGVESKLKLGIVGMFMGFQFIIRHNDEIDANVLYNPSTDAKIAFGATPPGDETSAAIFFHRDFVRRTEGNAEVFTQLKSPTFKSDLMSVDVRYGATKSRLDGKGIISLVEQDALA